MCVEVWDNNNNDNTIDDGSININNNSNNSKKIEPEFLEKNHETKQQKQKQKTYNRLKESN